MERNVRVDSMRRAMNHDKSFRLYERHYDQGKFDLPVWEIATCGNVAAATERMTIEALSASTRIINHEKEIEEKAAKLAETMAQDDEALKKAIQSGDRHAKTQASNVY